VSGGMNRAIELARRERADPVSFRKQPDLGPRDPPPITQQLEQLRRQHGKVILAPLALLDPQQHTLGVDIRHLQRHDLGDAQARSSAARSSPVLATNAYDRYAPRQLSQNGRRLPLPRLKTKEGEIEVSAERVARMAHRMFLLGGEGRSKNYAEKARKRIESRPGRKDDVAIVIAAGG
jgi:hypothetical protein